MDIFTKRLTPSDLAAVMRLQAVATAGLPPGYIRPKSADDFARFISGEHGAAFGVFEDSVLVASALVGIPGNGRANGSERMPHVPEADWPLHAAGLCSAMVHPASRGRGYQGRLFEPRFAYAAAAGMRWVIAGVHFRNVASWKTLLARGMSIVGMRDDVGFPLIGLIRSTRGPWLPAVPSESVAMRAADDAIRHQIVLQQGYVGIGFERDDRILYRRLGAMAA